MLVKNSILWVIINFDKQTLKLSSDGQRYFLLLVSVSGLFILFIFIFRFIQTALINSIISAQINVLVCLPKLTFSFIIQTP